MEVYGDNMLVKSKEAKTHLEDLQETSDTLRSEELRQIQIRSVLDMTSPRTVKEVQRLTGQVVTLNRFISKAIDKCLPFFKTLN